MSKFPSGVVTGDGVQAIFNDAQENEYALPAVNVVGSNSVNAVLETVAVNSPVIIQFSNGGGAFLQENPWTTQIRNLLSQVQFQVQCMFTKWPKLMEFRSFCILIMRRRKLLPWVDGMLDAGEKFYEREGKSSTVLTC